MSVPGVKVICTKHHKVMYRAGPTLRHKDEHGSCDSSFFVIQHEDIVDKPTAATALLVLEMQKIQAKMTNPLPGPPRLVIHDEAAHPFHDPPADPDDPGSDG